MPQHLSFFLNDLRDGPGLRNGDPEIHTAEEVLDMIADHREKCNDVTAPVKAENFTLDFSGNLCVWDKTMTPHATMQVLQACGIGQFYGERLMAPTDGDRALLLHNVRERWTSMRGEEQERLLRFYQVNGNSVLRAFLSDQYGIIDADQILREFIKRHPDTRLGFPRVKLSAETQSFQVMDLDGAWDIAGTLGDGLPGQPERDDLNFPGWDIRNAEVGGGSARLWSYLWRLVCMNGSIAASESRLTSRKIHRKSSTLQDLEPIFGEVRTAHQWQDALLSAAADKVEFNSHVLDPAARRKGKKGLFDLKWHGPLDMIDVEFEDKVFATLGNSFNRAQMWDHMSRVAHKEHGDNAAKRLRLEEAAGDLLFETRPLCDLVTVARR